MLTKRPGAIALTLLLVAVMGSGSALAGSPPPPSPEPPAPPSDLAAPAEGAVKTESGLTYRVLRPGSGTARPASTDMVTVHYTGWTAEGKVIDSSIARGRPLTVQMKKLIPGWIEALEGMVAGEQRRLWIPEAIGFQGNPSAPKGTTVYDVELLSFEPGPDVPPPDVAAPPSNAETAKSGLAWKVLREGHGPRHPGRASQVTVHYTGWTTDGKMFDSSVARGKPANFGLSQVIAGWTEGLQLMVEGEKRRFWIPEKLAYRGQDGKPKGMLVFDVELLAIQN